MSIDRLRGIKPQPSLGPRREAPRQALPRDRLAAFESQESAGDLKPERFSLDEQRIFAKVEILKALRQVGPDETIEKEFIGTILEDARTVLDRRSVRYEEVDKAGRIYLRILPDPQRPGSFLNRFAAKVLGRFALSEIRFDPLFLIENPANAGFTEDYAMALSCLDLSLTKRSGSMRHELVHAKRSRNLRRGNDHPYAGTVLTHGHPSDLQRSYRLKGCSLDESLANLESIFADAEDLTEENLAQAIGKAKIHREVIAGIRSESAKFTAWITPHLAMTAMHSQVNEESGLPQTVYRLKNDRGESMTIGFSQNPADKLLWGALVRPDGIELQLPLVGATDPTDRQNIEIFLGKLLEKERRFQDDLETAKTYEQIFAAIDQASNSSVRAQLIQIARSGGAQHKRLRTR